MLNLKVYLPGASSRESSTPKKGKTKKVKMEVIQNKMVRQEEEAQETSGG